MMNHDGSISYTTSVDYPTNRGDYNQNEIIVLLVGFVIIES